jgi:hypothetical protein
MTIYCKCGKELTINKQIGHAHKPGGNIPVCNPCLTCSIAYYEVGYADGAITGAHKTTLAQLDTSAGIGSI